MELVGVCCLVEVGDGFGLLLDWYFVFYVVDLDGLFIFEMGYCLYFEMV